jgi:hypothetical protein
VEDDGEEEVGGRMEETLVVNPQVVEIALRVEHHVLR